MRTIIFLLSLLLLAGCERYDAAIGNSQGRATLSFSASGEDVTRSAPADHFTRLHVMLFTESGERAFATVKTQTSGDADFGTLSVSVDPGTYTVVAVGHSSARTAALKSPQLVQFTASDGEKLTDTFCVCAQITVTDQPQHYDLTMRRMTAMVQFIFTDEDVSAAMTHILISYTGGSANFNPSTCEGTTRSTQSERRTRSASQTYQVFTFPFLAAEGKLKMTLQALDASGTVLHQRTLENVPVTRNRITTYRGAFFGEGSGTFSQSGFGFTVNAEWDGEEHYTF